MNKRRLLRFVHGEQLLRIPDDFTLDDWIQCSFDTFFAVVIFL